MAVAFPPCSLNYCVLDIGIQEVILEQLEEYPGHPRTVVQFVGNLAEKARHW